MGLIFQARAGGIAEGVATPPVFLSKEGWDIRSVIAVDTQLPPYFLMPVFGDGFGGLDGKPVEVEVLGVLIVIGQALGLLAAVASGAWPKPGWFQSAGMDARTCRAAATIAVRDGFTSSQRRVFRPQSGLTQT